MPAATPARSPLAVHMIGGPTAVLELAGLRLITDPTFDPPGSYEPRPGVHLTKTEGPAVPPQEIGPIDVALLSHDHHLDNLDLRGRELLTQIPHVLTTVTGARRLGAGATALATWEHVDLPRPDGATLRVTGLPAQHGPPGSEPLVGEVTGFLLTGEGLPSVYVSGDNASLDVIRAIVARVGEPTLAVLFAGGAQMPYLGDARLTLSSVAAARAARLLGARRVVPVHVQGWAHFSDGPESLRRAFADAGVADRLTLLAPGQRAIV